MRGESGSPARCSCGLGTPSLSRLLAAVGADVQTQGSASHAGGAAVCHRRRRRSLGCSGSCSAVLSASVSPSLPRQSPFALCGCCSLQPSTGLEELQYPLRTNASTGMNGWVHVFHMFQLNLPVAAHFGCRVSQRVHTSGSFPRRAVGWHTQC